jgi:hypothetical protein
MTSANLGWIGVKIKHKDGLQGIISSEFSGFGFVGLTFKLEDGTEHYVKLKSFGLDDKNLNGWEWYCPDFHPSARWLSFI